MGVRAGQGFGQKKPSRALCPVCAKHGVTQWKATPDGLMRYCQYCQQSWGEAGWRLAVELEKRLADSPAVRTLGASQQVSTWKPVG